jgi:FkbM family methyltransferase
MRSVAKRANLRPGMTMNYGLLVGRLLARSRERADQLAGFAPLARAAVIGTLERLNPTWWARLANGQHLRVDMGSTIGRSIWFRGHYEPQVTAVLEQYLRPGDTFVDLGANVGYFAIRAAAIVGASGRVLAVEPVADLARLIEQSARRNRLGNVQVIAVALGKTSGSGVMHVPISSGISYLAAEAAEPAPSGDEPLRASQAVRVMTLDELIEHNRIDAVRLLKIDVEGRELDVLLGARATLARFRPVLIVEVVDQNLNRFGVSQGELRALLHSLGYELQPTLAGHGLDDLYLPV